MFNWAFKKIVKLREKVAVDLGADDVEKPFLDHLDDLRTMIVRMCVTLLVVTLGTFFFYEELLAIIQYPLVLAGIKDKIVLQNLRVTGGFMTAMNVSLVAGVVLAFPLLLYFLLQFVLPGLRSNEKKVIFPALGVGGGLFLMGVVFSYYLVAPRALEFFYKFSVELGGATSKTEEVAAPTQVNQQQVLANGFGILWESTSPDVTNTVEVSVDGKTWSALTATGTDGKPVDPKGMRYVRISSAPTPGGAATTAAPATSATATITTMTAAKPFIWELTDYVKFVCQFVLIFGACFELPVVVMALVKLDVLNYKVMKGSRAWAGIIICVVAAIITPTQDALTLALLAAPMYLLYEICIWLAWWLEKKDRQMYPEFYKDQDKDEKSIEVSDDWDNDNYQPWNEGDEEENENEGEPKSSASSTPASTTPNHAASDESAPAPSEPAVSPSPGTDETSAGQTASHDTPPSTSGDAGSGAPSPSTDRDESVDNPRNTD